MFKNWRCLLFGCEEVEKKTLSVRMYYQNGVHYSLFTRVTCPHCGNARYWNLDDSNSHLYDDTKVKTLTEGEAFEMGLRWNKHLYLYCFEKYGPVELEIGEDGMVVDVSDQSSTPMPEKEGL